MNECVFSLTECWGPVLSLRSVQRSGVANVTSGFLCFFKGVVCLEAHRTLFEEHPAPLQFVYSRLPPSPSQDDDIT